LERLDEGHEITEHKVAGYYSDDEGVKRLILQITVEYEFDPEAEKTMVNRAMLLRPAGSGWPGMVLYGQKSWFARKTPTTPMIKMTAGTKIVGMPLGRFSIFNFPLFLIIPIDPRECQRRAFQPLSLIRI
jgi:hypothetical protein